MKPLQRIQRSLFSQSWLSRPGVWHQVERRGFLNARTRGGNKAFFISASATAVFLLPSSLHAVDWTSATNGNWNSSGSWSPASVPNLGTSGNTATINHSITWTDTADTVVNSGNTLTVNTGGSFTRTGSNTNWIQIGQTSAGGTLVLNGGTFNGGNTATIVVGQGEGANATGTININSGSLIAGTASGTSGSQYQMSNGNISVGMAKGSNAATGTINLGDGTGAAGTAILNLQTNNKELVLGTRSPWNATTASGTGTVTIKSDGILQGGTADIRIGRQASATQSSLTIESGGTANVRGSLRVGQDNGAKGNLTISGGTLTQTGTQGMWFGDGSGSTGSLTMTGGSLTTQQWISIGESGSGSANLGGSSLVTFANSMAVGANSGSSGTVTMSDSASLGSVENTFINIGRYSGSTGAVTLNGSSSLSLSHASSGLSVGNSGSGTLTINNTASVSVGSYIDVGRNSSASGTIHQNGGTVTTGVVTFQSTGTNTAVYNLNAGILALNSFTLTGGTSTGRDLNLNGGTLKARSSTTSFLNASTGMDVNVGNGGVTIDTNSNNITIGAALKQNGSGGLIKDGAGTLTLTNTNTYTGSTEISRGTLALSGSGSVASSLIIIGASTTFDVSNVTGGYTLGTGKTITGTGTIAGNITVGGTLSPGASPGSMSFADNLGLAGTLNLEIDGIGLNSFDRLLGDGANTLTLGGVLNLDNTGYTPALNDTITVFSGWQSITGSFASINGTDLGGGLSWDTSQLASSGILTVIPEPSAALLTGLGLLCFKRTRRPTTTSAS